LSKDVVTVPTSSGLSLATLPTDIDIVILDDLDRMQLALSPVLAPLDLEPNRSIVLFFDAEWNVDRTVGVSCLQIYAEHIPNTIYLLRVSLDLCLCIR
jgi:hypothetical protein